MDTSTQQGLAALKAGNKSLARTLFRKAIQQNHDDTQAWLGLSAAVESDFEKVQCLQTIMKIDPEHKIAKSALDQLVGKLFHGNNPENTKPDSASVIKTESINPEIAPLIDSPISGEVPAASELNELPIIQPTRSPAPDPFEVLRSRYAVTENTAVTPAERTGVAENVSEISPKRGYLIVSEEKSDTGEDPVIEETPEQVINRAQRPVVRRNKLLQVVLIGGGVLAALILVGVLVIVGAASSGPGPTPTPPFMAVAKPVLASDLTQTAPNLKLAFKPPTETPTTGIQPTGTPVPSATFPPTNRTLQVKLNAVETQVYSLRQLALVQNNVSAFPVTKGQVQDYFSKNLGGSDFTARLDNRKKGLILLGLVDQNFDIYSEVLNQRIDHIGGFYSPETQQIYLVTGLGGPVPDYVVFANEFDHALVDQNFNIRDAGVYPVCKFDSQHCRAIEALFEGDAELLLEQWASHFIIDKNILQQISSPSPIYTTQSQSLPPYLVQDALFAYKYGTQFVKTFYSNGDWAAVNKLYGRLPISTTQIMHPDKYIINSQPVNLPDKSVAQQLGENWSLIYDDSLGEWMTYLMLAYNNDRSAQVDPSAAKVASAGWNGDHYQIFEKKATRALALSAHWTFTTSPDLGEFSNIMKLMLETHNRGNRLEWLGRDCWQNSGQVSCYFAAGKDALWLEAPDKDTISTMLVAFPAFQ